LKLLKKFEKIIKETNYLKSKNLEIDCAVEDLFTTIISYLRSLGGEVSEEETRKIMVSVSSLAQRHPKLSECYAVQNLWSPCCRIPIKRGGKGIFQTQFGYHPT
jgi:hypothetical protein